MRNFITWVGLTASLCVAGGMGCSSDDGGGTGAQGQGGSGQGGSGQGGSGQGGSGQGGSGQGGSGQGGSGQGGNGGGGPACEGTQQPTNAAYCAGPCPAELDCSRSAARPVENCCVLLTEPGGNPNDPSALELTTSTIDFAAPSPGAPNLDCIENPPEPPSFEGDPPTVTMQGVLEPFSNGCEIKDVKIEVFTVLRTGNPATDGEPGDLVGSAVMVTTANPSVEEEKDGCPDDLVINRRYEYPDVPMYTELLVVTSGSGWRDLYTYNLYIGDGDPDLDASAMTYEREMRALADSDFGLIPTVAIGQTITPGNGAVGGEVHDCDNYRVQNAIVDINRSRAGLTYFNDDEQEPLPDVSRNQLGTGRTSIWSALDVPAGPARVSAAGLVDRGNGLELVSLGYHDIRVFPSAVTSVTFRGFRPYQVAR